MNRQAKTAVWTWWVAISGLAAWRLRDAPLIWALPTFVASAVFAVILLRIPADGPGVRVVAYLAALLANQGPAMVSGVSPLLPGHHLHPAAISIGVLVVECAGAVAAIATFLLTRRWVDARAHRRFVPRRKLAWHHVVGVGASAAAVYFLVLQFCSLAFDAGQHLFGITPMHYPYAAGDFTAWALACGFSGLAGAVEEPVFVGLLVLLWPRPRPTVFALVAVSSGVARATIHLYYAASAAHVGVAMGLIVLWCIVWSSASLLLIYRTRLLWPVIVAHSLSNYLASMHGPFTADATPMHVGIVATPLLVLLGLALVATFYGAPRAVDRLTNYLTRTWPSRRRHSQLR
jgi:hypothetical protein